MVCTCGCCDWVQHGEDMHCLRCRRVNCTREEHHAAKTPSGGTREKEPWTRAQVLGWKRKAEAYDVLVECCERLSEHQDDGSPLVEAMLDAVIEAKRLREKVQSGGGG